MGKDMAALLDTIQSQNCGVLREIEAMNAFEHGEYLSNCMHGATIVGSQLKKPV